jgi:hypothetical protein
MRILFVGDVVGGVGRRAVQEGLAVLRPSLKPDLVIANGENAAGGAGLTPATAKEMFRAGCHVITTGNHVWDQRTIVPCLEREERLLRPANYPPGSPGRGCCIVETSAGDPVAVINLMGRVFMPNLDDPFRAADALLEALPSGVRAIIVDFHAEATSEKMAFTCYLDGRVSAVFGTHTHVATADARILPGGTAAITDVGMTGPHDSVIGVEKLAVIRRFLTMQPTRYKPARGDVRLCGVVVDVSAGTGRATRIERIEIRESTSWR